MFGPLLTIDVVHSWPTHSEFQVPSCPVFIQHDFHELLVAFETRYVKWERAGTAVHVHIVPIQNPFHHLDIVERNSLL